MGRELIVFKTDTDAYGTNRGFVYQYLKTLIQWLKIYSSNSVNECIYCEYEDDTKLLDQEKNTVRFTQMKCYSTVFNLGHTDIKKSLYNFFILYRMYPEYEGSFSFETNSRVSSKDQFLDEWTRTQNTLSQNQNLLGRCIVEVRDILNESIIENRDSLVTDLSKKIVKLETKSKKITKKIKDQMATYNNEIEDIKEKANDVLASIADTDVLSDFVLRINWSFDDIGAEKSVEVLKSEALSFITSLGLKYPPNIIFGRLVSEIVLKSKEATPEARCLDLSLMQSILNETEAEINSKVDQRIIEQFQNIMDRLDSGFQDVSLGIEVIKTAMDRIAPTSQTPIPSEYIDLPESDSFAPEKLKEVIDKDPTKQSNLERKISKIDENDVDETEQVNFLVQVATELRCRYLLFLQELKVSNRHHTYSSVKALEAKVKYECTASAIKLKRVEDLNPIDFWSSFQEELVSLGKEFNLRVNKDIDKEIVYAQMYQMAAECHLKWHKEMASK
ncbi:dsDNA nuclease domain-containing protein [Paenibacillus odorifer]|uniref:dsDNA nuclease domain-containing protein n=1 Tax=Paenibacillus odorifer TaxID=189426 RepID=UPI000BA0A29F|nr:dsDNA nuclease domain-containing protein [Paenibacillus odorifer]OZQ64378.1 hypothetical protein CA596_28975 [Paenibacillus odorifer]